MSLKKLVNWEVFTREEKDALNKLIKTGQVEAITNVIPNINPEKELELQKIIDYLTPKTDGFESKVQKKIEKKGHPDTPEKEAKLQKELEVEYREFTENKELQELKRLCGLGNKESKKEAKEKYEAMKEKIALRDKEDKAAKKEEGKRIKIQKKEDKKDKKERSDVDEAYLADLRDKQKISVGEKKNVVRIDQEEETKK